MFKWIARRPRFFASMRIRGSLLHNQIGGAAVEFAFIFPVFLLLVLGILEFGRAIWTNYSLQNAVEDTTRYVLANPTVTDTLIVNRVADKLELIDMSKVTVTVTRESVSGVNFVAVTATYAFSTLEMLLPVGSFSLLGRSRVPLTPSP